MNYTKFQGATISKNPDSNDGVIMLYFALDKDVRNQFCREHNIKYLVDSRTSVCDKNRRIQIKISLQEEKEIEDAIKVEVDIDTLPKLHKQSVTKYKMPAPSAVMKMKSQPNHFLKSNLVEEFSNKYSIKDFNSLYEPTPITQKNDVQPKS